MVPGECRNYDLPFINECFVLHDHDLPRNYIITLPYY